MPRVLLATENGGAKTLTNAVNAAVALAKTLRWIQARPGLH